MIIEIQIPDEVYEQYGKSSERLVQRLLDTAGVDINPNLRVYQLSSEDLGELRQHFGPNIKDAAALVALIRKVGTIRMQKAAYQLDSDQIERLTEQAYFYSKEGEPRDCKEEGFTKAEHATVVQRYVKLVLTDALNIVLGIS